MPIILKNLKLLKKVKLSMRLDRFLANAGYGTRKEVKELIKAKRISVNGDFKVKDSQSVDYNKDEICIDGEKIEYKEFFYILLNNFLIFFI